MATTYDLGDLVRITGTFTTAAGVATDPTAVLCTYTDPSGDATTLTYGTDVALVKSSTGVYYVDVNADEQGVWEYRFYATGTGQAADEGSFIVQTDTQFSYNAGLVATTPLYKIRLEVGDTTESGSQFTDAELNWFYSDEGSNTLKASARALEVMAQRYSHRAAFTADGLTVEWTNAAKAAREQANALRSRASEVASGGYRARTIHMTRHDGYSTTVVAGS